MSWFRLSPPAAVGRLVPGLVGVVAALAIGACGGSSQTAGTSVRPSALVSIGAGLHGPAGLRATLFAQGPKTTAAFAYDSSGRLWLTAAGLESHTEDGVYVVPASGGVARKVVGGLDDPLGIVWYRNTLYVASVGRVDAFSDFNGRRFLRRREILDGPARGAENNLLVMAPDGRFLLGITATCDHCRPASKWAGSIASFEPDGSGLRLYASRIRAPFGLAFFPGTSDLLVTMNQRDDLGAATPGDWLAQVREGEDWRFPGCYGQGGSACAGVPGAVAVLDKHAAVGGLVILTGQLGAAFGTSALVAEWNSAKVQRVALSRSASDISGTVAPFLTGIANPLALALAPEDSVLVGDWQTGRIYRISTGVPSGT